MRNMIERYVYDVARRLPEKDREEVKKELRANIYDMLPEGADDEAVKKVLYELGSPASLAEKYRQRPRYLISPKYYDEYVGVLKWVLPLVGVVVMVIGFAVGAFDAVKSGSSDYALLFSGVMAKGFSMGISAVFQALIWTTIGFVAAERGGEKAEKSGVRGWKIEDLPEVQQHEKARIPLSASIAELIVMIVFSVIGLLFCTGKLPFFFSFSGGVRFYTIFSESFLALCVPAILVSVVLGVIEGAAKIRDRRWSPFVCAAVVANALIGMAIAIYLINRPNMFSAEFQTFLNDVGFPQIPGFHRPAMNGSSLSAVVLSALVVIGSVSESITAVKRTIEYRTK